MRRAWLVWGEVPQVLTKAWIERISFVARLISVCVVSISLAFHGPPRMTELGYLSGQEVQHAERQPHVCSLWVGRTNSRECIALNPSMQWSAIY